jgi:hypothetical protein
VDPPDPRTSGYTRDDLFFAVPVIEEISVFRLVWRDIPDARDFKTPSPDRAAAADQPEIDRLGFSVFATFADADLGRLARSRIAHCGSNQARSCGSKTPRRLWIGLLSVPEVDPEEHYGIVEFDADGHRVGEPLVPVSPSALF